MAGVRLIHPTQRNVRYTIVQREVPYKEPYQCTAPEFGGCGSVHLFKTHHLNLDETGAVIVSTGVYERLKGRLFIDGFLLSNQVNEPPTLAIGLGQSNGHWKGIPVVRSPSNEETDE
jgi:hypothetical protein